MAEYIDTSTEITIWDICEDGAVHFVKTTVAQFLLSHLKCNDLINGIPTADVQSVVRCKDCKYRQHDTIFGQSWCNGKRVTDDWFCADGIKKEES